MIYNLLIITKQINSDDNKKTEKLRMTADNKYFTVQ